MGGLWLGTRAIGPRHGKNPQTGALIHPHATERSGLGSFEGFADSSESLHRKIPDSVDLTGATRAKET